ncbi:hypothetical protein THAOC_08969 [Thalassiosira oceanica]|uniref:Uncharacterized protein n=1 Tax=Thalassiosira oceanica TaxID=159749 RepID=K0SWE5_THAOC|nr:hypothetical protein THAOC_08969 [Thalassiosira oceanica]|eukprot:EJK69740.1 hypothetical protein THAOC_08969 [Thalassiosira oceanica]
MLLKHDPQFGQAGIHRDTECGLVDVITCLLVMVRTRTSQTGWGRPRCTLQLSTDTQMPAGSLLRGVQAERKGFHECASVIAANACTTCMKVKLVIRCADRLVYNNL